MGVRGCFEEALLMGRTLARHLCKHGSVYPRPSPTTARRIHRQKRVDERPRSAVLTQIGSQRSSDI